MKHIGALAFFLVALTAAAGPLPGALEKSLKPYDLKDSGLAGGVLTATFDRPVVTFGMFESFVTNGVCAPALMNPKSGWGGAKIERIEVRNDASGQGFALRNAYLACQDIGNMAGGAAAVKRYLAPIAMVCTPGQPCRVRRAGERTSGDE